MSEATAKLEIVNLKLECFIGVYEHEKDKRQSIIICLTLLSDFSVAMQSDNIDDTLNYDAVVAELQHLVARKHFHLLEHLVYSIATNLLERFNQLLQVQVAASKNAIKESDFCRFTLELNREDFTSSYLV